MAETRLLLDLQPIMPGAVLARQLPDAVWAGLTITVGGHTLTRHRREPDEAEQDWIALDIRPVLKWFVANLPMICVERNSRFFGADGDGFEMWRKWRETAARRFPDHQPISALEIEDDDRREAWVRRHFLRFADTGATLPDLALIASEGAISLSWRPRRSADGRLHFTTTAGEELITRDSLFTAIAKLHAACASNQDAGTSLEASLRQIRDAASLRWPDVEAFAEPGEKALISALARGSQSAPEDDPAFLASLEVYPAEGAAEALSALQRELARPGQMAADLPERPAVSAADEQEGYAAALDLRDRLGLNGKPVDALGAVLDRLGVVDLGPFQGDPGNKMVCGRQHGGAAALAVIKSAGTRTWMTRMETARGLGRLVLDRPATRWATGGASSRVSGGAANRRAGAFAAQFLLPETGIRQIAGTAPDAAAAPAIFERLMSDFGVGARTAAYHLWNLGFLSSRQVRNDLVEAYSGGGS